MGRNVASAKECREFAEVCLGWAKNAESDREREILQQLAGTWLHAAARLQGVLDSAPSGPEPRRLQRAGR